MLIYSYLYVRDKYGEEQAKRLILYGQERNQEIYAICKMNLLLHGAENVHVESGDTLLYPKFREKEGKGIKRFDIVLANPPWNQDGYDEDALKAAEFRDRFVYGYTPDSSADWAWAEHMLASAKDDGRVGLVIDNGCLFRGGREQVIRSKILDKDLVECVILLPEKLFYNTGAPGAILVFRKRKPTERKGRILFINASNEYIKHPTVRRLNSLSDENIKRIVDAYKSFKDVENFAKVVSLDKVKANDYNLNVTLYVMPAGKEEEIDVVKV
ncbi:MAG: N-6 DNA methylase [Candidatus Nitrosocaldus sp.]